MKWLYYHGGSSDIKDWAFFGGHLCLQYTRLMNWGWGWEVADRLLCLTMGKLFVVVG